MSDTHHEYECEHGQLKRSCNICDLQAHIRELQAEVNIYKSCTTPTEINLAARILELESEVEKLKAERREFGLRVAALVAQKFNHNSPVHEIHYAAIVEQELNK